MSVKHCPNPTCPHRAATGSLAEYPEHIVRCADCGTTLKPGPAGAERPVVPEDGQVPMKGRLVTVGICRLPGSVHVARAILESAGIPCFIAGENASSVFGFAISPRVNVAEEHAQQAGELLAAEGLGFKGATPEAEARIEAAEQEHTRRTGMSPWVYILLFFLAIVLTVVLRSLD